MTNERAVALFGLGVVLFGYPLTAVMSRDVLIAGVPLLYGYLFGAWALFVAALAGLAECSPPASRPEDASASPEPPPQERPEPQPQEPPPQTSPPREPSAATKSAP